MIVQEIFSLFGFKIDDASISKAEKAIDGVIKKAEGFSQKANLFLTLPITGFFTAAAYDAAESTEALNRFNIVFGETADNMNEWSTQIAHDLNLTDTEVKTLLANFQQFFLGLGAGKKDASEMTRTMYELAADFAAFNGKISQQEAGQLILSGLYGMGRGLKQYGIIIDDTKLEQEGFKLGIQKTAEAMTDLEKASIRLQIIKNTMTEQGVIGQASKATERLWSLFRGLRKMISELTESFGQLLEPALTKLFKHLVEITKYLAFDLSPGIKWAIIVFTGLLALIGPLSAGFIFLVKIGQVLSSVFVMLSASALKANSSIIMMFVKFGLWGAVILGIIALLALLFDDIYQYVNGGNSLIGKFIEPWATLGPKIRAQIMPYWILFKDSLNDLKDVLLQVLGFIADVMGDNTEKAAEHFSKLVDKIVSLAGNLTALLVPLAYKILEAIILGVLVSFDRLMIKFRQVLYTFIDSIVQAAVDAIAGLFVRIENYLYTSRIGKLLSKGIEFVKKDTEEFNRNLDKPLSYALDYAKKDGAQFDRLMGFKEVNKTLNVSVTPNIQVPEGTPAAQLQYIQEGAQEIFRKGIEGLTRSINLSYQEREK